jgi:hypothetical protein
MATTGKTRSGVPYQYKVNTKKRVVATREGLASDEEEVEDLWAVEQIEEILHKHMRGRQEVQEWEEKATILSILMSVWNP